MILFSFHADGSVKSSTVLIAIFVPLAAVIVLAVAYRKYK